MTDPIEIRAAVLHEARTPLRVETLLLAPPGPAEVLVRVAAAGVCHSDLHLAEGHLGHGRWPIVLGHEGAGIVEDVGAGVTHVAVGDPVAFCFVPPCRACRACRAGRFHLCEQAAADAARGTLPGGGSRLSFPGGGVVQHFICVSCFAERCIVPAEGAVPLPPELPLWQAALLGCSVVTGIGAVRNTAQVRVGETVCVIGCGGVGLQVVNGARLAGAGRIVAVDRSAEKLERAVATGATDAVDATRGDPVAAVLDHCPGGVDHAFEVIGRPETIRQAWDMIRPGGSAIVVGISPRGAEVSLPAFDLIDEKNLKGCYYGSSNVAVELPALVDMVSAGRIDLADAVSHVIRLEQIDEAFDRLRSGEGARSVIAVDEAAAGIRPQG
jgi:S-(hydroxymethyl)glutathione dehydrogenase / alcohol dehydrogenase